MLCCTDGGSACRYTSTGMALMQASPWAVKPFSCRPLLFIRGYPCKVEQPAGQWRDGLWVLQAVEQRCRRRGIGCIYTHVDDGKARPEKRQQRIFKKMGYNEVARCTMWHWLLNKPGMVEQHAKA